MDILDRTDFIESMESENKDTDMNEDDKKEETVVLELFLIFKDVFFNHMTERNIPDSRNLGILGRFADSLIAVCLDCCTSEKNIDWFMKFHLKNFENIVKAKKEKLLKERASQEENSNGIKR
jgi:hypothetical protein